LAQPVSGLSGLGFIPASKHDKFFGIYGEETGALIAKPGVATGDDIGLLCGLGRP
jgi:hypothetical protein